MTRILIIAGIILLLALPAAAASLPYDASWWTADSGGVYATTDAYTLGATAGQPDAATVSGGWYQVQGGYWPGAIVRHPTEYIPVGSVLLTLDRTVTYGQITIIVMAIVAIAVWPRRWWQR